MKILPYDTAYSSYSEESQAVDVRICFVNEIEPDVYQPMFIPAMCRDYLNDILHSEFYKVPINNVFGFSYNPAKQHIDRDQIKLLVVVGAVSLGLNLSRNLIPLLNKYEALAGWSLSTLETEDNKNFIVKGDAKWLTCSMFLASYTLLVRLASHDKTVEDILNIFDPKVINKYKGTPDWKFLTMPRWKCIVENLEQAHQYVLDKELGPSGFAATDTNQRTMHCAIGLMTIFYDENLDKHFLVWGTDDYGNHYKTAMKEFTDSKLAA